MDEKYEKQLSYCLIKKNDISKFKGGTTWKDILRELEGKYGKMKPMLQIWKDNGLIKNKRRISVCKYGKMILKWYNWENLKKKGVKI